ncbi:MAG: GGDEF domain-containing protein [Phenylobacterium zucineum]|nr:MAG: GGDEF domain-containing protein [Phenylobacterium zucineum]
MKVTGARTEPLSATRRRPTAASIGGASATAAVGRVDSAAFLGISRAEMTPAVQAAIETLLSELDSLRSEVSQLKGRLARAEDLADRDALTPLLNRRAFVRELGRITAMGERYGMPASLVYFDLDGFKQVNDRDGHAAGDEALKTVAEKLKVNTRETDVAARMGGDEFAVILMHTDGATARAKAANLAQAIAEPPHGLGCSWGVREIGPGADAETLLASADAAMFDAKRQRKAG